MSGGRARPPAQYEKPAEFLTFPNLQHLETPKRPHAPRRSGPDLISSRSHSRDEDALPSQQWLRRAIQPDVPLEPRAAGAPGRPGAPAAEVVGPRVSAPPKRDRAASEWAGGTSVRLWGKACVRPPPGRPIMTGPPGGRGRLEVRACAGVRLRARARPGQWGSGAAGQQGSEAGGQLPPIGGGGWWRLAAGERGGRRDGGHPRFPVFRFD